MNIFTVNFLKFCGRHFTDDMIGLLIKEYMTSHDHKKMAVSVEGGKKVTITDVTKPESE